MSQRIKKKTSLEYLVSNSRRVKKKNWTTVKLSLTYQMLRGVSCDSIIRAGHKKRLCCIIVPILVDGCKFGHFMLTLLDGFLKKTSFFRNTHDGLSKKRIHEVIC